MPRDEEKQIWPMRLFRMGTLNCFNFNKVDLMYCNSLIGLCLGAKKIFLFKEIVQIEGALNCFETLP